MNIILLTDRINLLDSCSKYMSDYIQSLGVKAKVYHADSITEFENISDIICPDIAYIDMETSGKSEEMRVWLEDIKPLYPKCIYAVVADDERYAVWGYKQQLADYMVFPPSEQDIYSSVERIVKTNFKNLTQSFYVKIRGVWEKISAEEVICIETSNHRINFYMSDGSVFSEKGNFDMINNIISCTPFLFRCHKSYAVNGRYIVGMTQTAFAMSNGKSISISRPYRVDSRAFYAQTKTEVNKKTYPNIKYEEVCTPII